MFCTDSHFQMGLCDKMTRLSVNYRQEPLTSCLVSTLVADSCATIPRMLQVSLEMWATPLRVCDGDQHSLMDLCKTVVPPVQSHQIEIVILFSPLWLSNTWFLVNSCPVDRMLPDRHWAITWTNADQSSMRDPETCISEVFDKIAVNLLRVQVE